MRAPLGERLDYEEELAEQLHAAVSCGKVFEAVGQLGEHI